MRRAVLLAFTVIALLVGAAYSQELSRVGLVVVLEGGEVVTRCVEFEGSTISGFEALLRSGLTVQNDVEGLGTTVCSIEGSGCPSNDCWCQCKGGDCLYWSYWHVQEGEWDYSRIGAGMYQLSDGSVDGWVWDIGSPNNAPAPPAISFDQICSEETEQRPATEPLVDEMLLATAAADALTAADASHDAAAVEGTVDMDKESAPAATEKAGSPAAAYILFGVLLIGLVLLWDRNRK